jgi:hypothetical protein
MTDGDGRIADHLNSRWPFFADSYLILLGLIKMLWRRHEKQKMTDKPVASSELKKAQDDALSASIKVFENFYSFLISFAITQATLKIAIALDSIHRASDAIGYVLLYIAFLATIVPFYQGMNRFLYSTHVVRPLEKPDSKASPLLLDIYAFLTMGCIIFLMGRYLDNPYKFFYLWSCLLVVDIIWSLIVWQVQNSKQPIWALNNFIWLIFAWTYWYAAFLLRHINNVDAVGAHWLPYGLVFIQCMRSFFDYKINWKFYFPHEYRGK